MQLGVQHAAATIAHPATGDAVPAVDGGIDVGSSAPAIGAFDLVAAPNPDNVLAYYIDWRTSDLAQTHLDVECGDDYAASFHGDELRALHTVFVMGLYAGASCVARARAGVTGDFEEIEFSVDAPHLVLPRLDVLATSAEVEPGWTLFNLFDDTQQIGVTAALVDELGRYRWYHRRPFTGTSQDDDVRAVPRGVLIGGSYRTTAAIVSWEGSVEWIAPFDMHHHIEPAREPGQFLALAVSTAGCPTTNLGDRVLRYDEPTDTVVDQWQLCEHFVPPADVPGWSHLNGIAHYPDGRSFLLSSRNQSSLFRVDAATGEIMWQLGWGGDFLRPTEAWFSYQHAPEVQPNGNILIFDNGADTRLWSRALELVVDETAMEVSVAWEFRATPDIFAEFWGDADRLANGNTLVTFGRRDGSDLIEASAAGAEAWHLSVASPWGVYRAERLVAPTGYVLGDL